MSIKLNLQTKKAIGQLGRRGNLLQIVAAETVNEAARDLDEDYKKRLERKQRLRNRKFTLGAVKVNESNPIRRSGEPRQLSKINAVVGVRKMKGGRKHYLAKLEEGDINRGNSKTLGKVPVPLTAGRTSLNIEKPVAASNRLRKGQTQTLRGGGKPFGIPGDRFKSPGGRFAALYKYKRGASGLTGDLSKPFFFIDNSKKLGIFKFIKGRAHKIRSLEKTTTKTPKSPNFKNSVNNIKPGDIQREFVKKAEKRVE